MTHNIVIFDLDRTITQSGTFTPFLLSTRTSAPARALLLLRFLPAMAAYKIGLIDRTALKNKMMALALARLSADALRRAARIFAERVVQSGLRPAALAAIERHKSAGDHLILATASIDLYANLFADALGFDETIATRTNCLDARTAPPHILGQNCYGAEKQTRVTQTLQARQGAPRHSTFYSDHHSDFDLMQTTDAPFAVSPDAKSRRLAQAANIPVLDWACSGLSHTGLNRAARPESKDE